MGAEEWSSLGAMPYSAAKGMSASMAREGGADPEVQCEHARLHSEHDLFGWQGM